MTATEKPFPWTGRAVSTTVGSAQRGAMAVLAPRRVWSVLSHRLRAEATITGRYIKLSDYPMAFAECVVEVGEPYCCRVAAIIDNGYLGPDLLLGREAFGGGRPEPQP